MPKTKPAPAPKEAVGNGAGLPEEQGSLPHKRPLSEAQRRALALGPKSPNAGRPRTDPAKFSQSLPRELYDAMQTRLRGTSRNAWIVEAIREKLEREP